MREALADINYSQILDSAPQKLNAPVANTELSTVLEQIDTYHALLEQFGVDTLPLNNELPVEYSLSPSIKAVADHEAQHGIVAYLEGYGSSIIGIKTRPDGDALGWLRTKGNIPSKVFRKIAAGGMTDTVSGAAEGYGGDEYQLRMSALIDNLNPDAEVSAAKNSAAANIAVFTREELNEIGNALGFMGYTTGEEFQQIIVRSQIIAACKEKNIDLGLVTQTTIDLEERKYFYEQRALQYMLRDIPEEGSIVITYPDDEVIYVEGKLYCPECENVGIHKPTCSKITDKLSAVRMDLPREATLYHFDSSRRN